MRKYIYIFIISGILVLAGFLLYAVSLRMPDDLEIDNTAINEITRQTGMCWLDFDRLDELDFRYRFFVIDNNGNLYYQSDNDLPYSLQPAIRQGFLPMDVSVGQSVVGKAVIEVLPEKQIGRARTDLSNAMVVAFVLLCLLIIAALLVLGLLVIKPFRRLEAFAHKISAGRLDEPLPMDRNNIFGLFTQSFDVMRASLLEAREAQLSAERAKKELIASLNHDIKTPITSILLTSELLQASGVDPGVEEKLRSIDMKANQISRLMNDMMHSALEELGELKVVPVSCGSGVLLDILKDADYLSRIRANDVPSCLVELDAIRIEQVLGNIVANSYKYADTGIDVSFAIRGGFLHIGISDYGEGVEPDELELICTKFYRGANAVVSQKEGEGLGLYVAKHLMEKMGGGLEALNRSDGFTIRLWVKLSQ